MTEIVKVDVVPNVAKPVEGTHYNVIAGSPVLGDKVRITTLSGAIIFESCYTPPPAPSGPLPKLLRSHEVLNLLPAAVVKAIKESAVAAVVKRYEMFKITPSWTKSEGTALFNDIESAGLMTNTQNTDALALWPVV